MAAPYRAELHDIDSVLNWYEEQNGIHYKIYAGTSSDKPQFCRYYFDGTEKEIGLQELNKALQGLKSNIDNTNPYIIQVFAKPKKAKGGDLSPLNTTQIIFQLNKAERYLPYNGMGMMPQQASDPELKNILAKIVETQNILISKLSADELEDEEPEEKKGLIGSLLENEQIQQMAVAAIMGFLNKGIPSNAPTALAGIPDADQESKALQALELLKNKDEKYGDHLLYLANIDSNKYNFLLSFIK